MNHAMNHMAKHNIIITQMSHCEDNNGF